MMHTRWFVLASAPVLTLVWSVPAQERLDVLPEVQIGSLRFRVHTIAGENITGAGARTSR